MKTRKIIGAIVACVGLSIALCVADGSKYELLLRFIGAAFLTIGCIIGKFFDHQM